MLLIVKYLKKLPIGKHSKVNASNYEIMENICFKLERMQYGQNSKLEVINGKIVYHACNSKILKNMIPIGLNAILTNKRIIYLKIIFSKYSKIYVSNKETFNNTLCNAEPTSSAKYGKVWL